MRWIKCSSRLPAIGEEVIIAFKRPRARKSEVAAGYLDESYPSVWTLSHDWWVSLDPKRVIKWMPLPKYPEDE